MSLRPTTVAAANYEIVKKALLAGEMEVRLTRRPIVELGVLEITAIDTGVWTPDSVAAGQLADYPMEVVAMLDTELDAGSAAVTLTLTGTSSADAPLSGVATVQKSGFHDDQSWFFPRSFSAQFVTTPAADTLIKTVDAEIAVEAASANSVGAKFKLMAIPAVSVFQGIFCAQLDDFDTKAREFVAIQCGMDAAAQTKPGMLPEPALTVSAKTKQFADGLYNFNGGRSSVLLIPRKERRLASEYIFIKGFGGRISARGGEGATPVAGSITGPYEEMVVLPAL